MSQNVLVGKVLARFNLVLIAVKNYCKEPFSRIWNKKILSSIISHFIQKNVLFGFHFEPEKNLFFIVLKVFKKYSLVSFLKQREKYL